MPYEFPEDYESLEKDFFEDKHIKLSPPGSKQTSTTISKLQYNRVKMLALLHDENISKTLALVINLGCSQLEQSLKEARKSADIEASIVEQEKAARE